MINATARQLREDAVRVPPGLAELIRRQAEELEWYAREYRDVFVASKIARLLRYLELAGLHEGRMEE